MKIGALVANAIVPGVGTLIVGQNIKGIIQLGIGVFAWVLLIALGWLFVGLIGLPMLAGVWLWAVIDSAIQLGDEK